jgi:hypothetical protein
MKIVFALLYLRLYSIAINSDFTVTQAFSKGISHIEFRRQLVSVYLQE